MWDILSAKPSCITAAAESPPPIIVVASAAGIDKDKLLATKAKINQSIRDVAKGNIDKTLFKRAQNALKRTYQSNEDQESLLLMQLLANTLRGRSLTIEERIKKVVNFTPEKLTRFAQSLFLNESYCLQ